MSGEGVVEVNLGEWRRRAERLESETFALYLAYRSPRTSLHAKLFAAIVVGLVFSPIDLIPDFMPILDDLVVITLGVALALRMILSESRRSSREMVEKGETPVSRAAAVAIVILWLALAVSAILFASWMIWG